MYSDTIYTTFDDDKTCVQIAVSRRVLAAVVGLRIRERCGCCRRKTDLPSQIIACTDVRCHRLAADFTAWNVGGCAIMHVRAEVSALLYNVHVFQLYHIHGVRCSSLSRVPSSV